ncbi:nitroreductase [Parvularcula sp. IMCC14364]|uniref:nitroreductase family protein n=1 Tax=Parvularcula sp. IMCC14364 TaxID=3067902 RepID=UPI0027412865|nr:nitroreductase [Parvularcula sp. IMCC14364]
MPLPDKPQLGDSLPSAHPSDETLRLLALRRSTTVKTMNGPGPDAEQLAQIMEIGARVPDHRRVCPYRFIVFDGEARAEIGPVFREGFLQDNPDASEEAANQEAHRFMRAPTIVAVVFSPQTEHRTPLWEQSLTAGAVCQNMLIAASAMGFAVQWLTEWYAYNRHVLAAMGLETHEQIAGFLYFGTAEEDPKERPRVDAASLITHWQKTA